MSYRSRRTITGMVAGTVLLVGYVVYAVSGSSADAGTLRSWALAILIFIGASALALIIIQILFHVAVSVGIAAQQGHADASMVNRILAASMVEDERDQLIALKAARAGFICVGLGFVGALATLALGGSGVVALHVLLGAFVAAELVGGMTSIYLDEAGVHSG